MDGPGTDIAAPQGSLVKSIAALVDGHIGDNGINNNLEKIKHFLIQQSIEAEKAGETLSIFGVGWSRGGFTLCQMRQWLYSQIIDKTMKVETLELYLIDSVLGGPTDRLRYLFNDRKPSGLLSTNVKIHGYYSHNGNLNLWEILLQYFPEKWKFNTPFFSAVMDKNSNSIYCHEDKRYRHIVTNWLFPATHEALIGRSNSPVEAWSGDIVLADIVRNLAEQSFAFQEQWQQAILAKGQLALEQLRESRIACLYNRKFLNNESLTNTIFGQSLSAEDDINLFSSIRDFSSSVGRHGA